MRQLPRRRLTQLDLALRAEVSARHLSFIETGRSRPTSEMIIRLAQQLDVPLRERNVLLLSGGYAPAYPANGLGDAPMSAVHEAIEHVLQAHEPFPAVVIDARWELVAANDAVPLLTEGAAAALLEPPVNVLRLSLHPDGMASRIVNLGEWRAHLLDRLNREIGSTADPALIELRDELATYPSGRPTSRPDSQAILVPLRLRVRGTELSLFSTTTVFGTPRDITLSELAIESFYPADAATAAFLRRQLSAASHSPTWQVIDFSGSGGQDRTGALRRQVPAATDEDDRRKGCHADCQRPAPGRLGYRQQLPDRRPRWRHDHRRRTSTRRTPTGHA